VCLDRVVPGEEGVASVSSDNLAGGRLAAQALLDAGSVKPVILCSRDDLKAGLSTIGDRIRGFAEVMAANGLDWSRRDIIHSRMGVDECRASVARAVRAGRCFDGVFSTLDIGAIGAILGLEDMGLAVPMDVNVVGFDDIAFGKYAKPALTTIRQDTVQLANVGAETLLAVMANPGEAKRQVQLPVSLVVRDSTRSMCR
jgi:DNA-binding LacI/PurR family transcriptional regulator